MKKTLIGVALLLLILGGFLFAVHQATKSKAFTVITVETTISWKDGPDIALNAATLAKLNAEVDQIVQKELPGTKVHYPVVSIGKRWVEVMYAGDSNVPVTLQKTLNDYIKKRLPELAREQGH